MFNNDFRQGERYENKMFVENVDDGLIEKYLSSQSSFLTKPYPDRFVNSLYFDNYDLQNYRDNIEGQSDRIKVRLRWYGDLENVSGGSLEFKIKRGKLGYKTQIKCPPFQILNKSHREIIDYIGNQLQGKSRIAFEQYPVITQLVKYKRAYYEAADSSLRLTIDRNICFFDQSTSVHYNLHCGVYRPEWAIIEFKSPPHANNHMANAINQLPFQVTKSSKYIMATQLSTLH